MTATIRKNLKFKILPALAAAALLAAAIGAFAAPAGAQVQLETGLLNPQTGQVITQLPAGQELPSYINYLFIFGLALITFLAFGFMIIGGVQYILAAGNIAKVEDAKDTIKQALLGLGLLLVSYLLLRTINPDLVNLQNPSGLLKLPQIVGTGGNVSTVSNAIAGQPCGAVDLDKKSADGQLMCYEGKWHKLPPSNNYTAANAAAGKPCGNQGERATNDTTLYCQNGYWGHIY